MLLVALTWPSMAKPGENHFASAPRAAAPAPHLGGAVAPHLPARAITILPLPAAPAGRYRCDEPRGFYPAVGACSVPWELVADLPIRKRPTLE